MILTGGALWSVALFLGCWGARVACARDIDKTLHDRLGFPVFATPFWVLPARDILSVIEIGTSFLINEVIWRGHRLAAGGVVSMPTHVGGE
jgi:hypothetical protein